MFYLLQLAYRPANVADAARGFKCWKPPDFPRKLEHCACGLWLAHALMHASPAPVLFDDQQPLLPNIMEAMSIHLTGITHR